MSLWYETQLYNFDPGDYTEQVTGSLWRNDTDSLYLYKIGTNDYYISATIGSLYKLDGVAITTLFYKCGGYRYFLSSAGYVWYDGSYWCISAAPNFGVGASKAWWRSSSLVGTYAAQGVATGTKVVTKELNGWHKTYEKHGIYAAVGTATGTKRVGMYQFDMGPAYDTYYYPTFKESYELYGSYRVLYGYPYSYPSGLSTIPNCVIWWDDTNWILSKTAGTKDAAVGYWTGGTDKANPTDGTYTLTCSDEDTTLPATMTASSVQILATYNDKDIYLTEVGTWLS